jgi:hypothetical protein
MFTLNFSHGSQIVLVDPACSLTSVDALKERKNFDNLDVNGMFLGTMQTQYSKHLVTNMLRVTHNRKRCGAEFTQPELCHHEAAIRHEVTATGQMSIIQGCVRMLNSSDNLKGRHFVFCFKIAPPGGM